MHPLTNAIRSERIALAMLRLAIVPALIVLIYEGSFGSLRWAARGDQAVLELLLREAMRGSHLLGPYSQFNWYHPGPLYFYVLAPFYALSGGTTSSLYLAASVLSLACVAGLLLVHASRDRTNIGRATFALLLTVTVTAVAVRVPDGALVASPLSEIWNPIVTLLPFALMIVAGAAVASRSLRLIPLLVFIHAFITQTHVSYLLPATAVLVLSMASGLLRADRSTKRRWLLVSGGMVLILWLPPIVAILRGDYGNALDVAGFVLFGERPSVPLLPALGYSITQLHAPLLRPLDLGAPAGIALGIGLTGLQFAAAAWWLRRSNWRELTYGNALALLPPGLMVVALCQAAQLVSTDERVFYYQTLWYGVLGCFGWFGVLAFLVERTSTILELTRDRVIAGLGVLLVLTIGVSWRETEGDFTRGAALMAQATSPDPVVSTADALVGLFTDRSEKEYVLAASSPAGWGTLAGVLVQLRRQGHDAKVSRRWQFMFGNGTRYAKEETGNTVEISTAGFSHRQPVFKAFGTTTLTIPEALTPAQARISGVRGKGVLGDAQRPVSGPAAPEGVAWNAAGAVILKQDSRLELDLPQTLVATVELVGDGNDTYVIGGSEDGTQFNSVGVIPAVNAWGLRRRRTVLHDQGPFLGLRVQPGHGDGSFSVAELRLHGLKHACRVVKAVEVERNPSLLCDGSAPAEGAPWDDPTALKLKKSGASVVVSMPNVPVADGVVDGFSLVADGNDAFKVEGSFDGNTFQQLGELPSPNRIGLRSSTFYFNDGTQWPYVRLSPVVTDGSCSIAEILPIVNLGTALEFGSAAIRPHLLDGWSTEERNGGTRWNWALGMTAGLSVPLEPGRPYRVLLRARSAPLGGEKQLVTIGFNHSRVTDFELSPTLQEHSFDLDAGVVAKENNLRLVFRSYTRRGEGDPRPLAALFESMSFRPNPE
jgi:hypothetical protein